jgi:hypothetical protein
MAYTREGIMSQVYVAFGQGTGAVRVSHGACVALYERYHPRIGEDLLARWEGEAVQVLERIRAIGRTAAAHMALAGENVLAPARLTDAARRVEVESDTERCPPDPYSVSHRDDLATEPYTRDSILAQILVAFGQGTGSVRVSQEACQPFYERYAPRIDAGVLAVWRTEGVQVLERIRAIGRTAALQASLAGGTAISRETVAGAMQAVEAVSRTVLCPPGGGGAEEAAGKVAAEPVNVVV